MVQLRIWIRTRYRKSELRGRQKGMRRGNPRRRRGRRLLGKVPYFFLAPFLAGFFAAAFFVAIGTPPPFSLRNFIHRLFHIAEIALLVKFFFCFLSFSSWPFHGSNPIRSDASRREGQNVASFRKARAAPPRIIHKVTRDSNPSMHNCLIVSGCIV